MKKILVLAAIATAPTALLAGCSSPGHVVASTGSPATYTPVAAASPSASPSPSSRARPSLTVRQARTVYLRIVDPSNKLIDIANRDFTDAAPWSQTQADILATNAGMRTEAARFRAYRWPQAVQGYITAMVLNSIPDSITCNQQQARTAGYNAAQMVEYTSQACLAASNDTTASTVRARLHLPPVN